MAYTDHIIHYIIDVICYTRNRMPYTDDAMLCTYDMMLYTCNMMPYTADVMPYTGKCIPRPDRFSRYDFRRGSMSAIELWLTQVAMTCTRKGKPVRSHVSMAFSSPKPRADVERPRYAKRYEARSSGLAFRPPQSVSPCREAVRWKPHVGYG